MEITNSLVCQCNNKCYKTPATFKAVTRYLGITNKN